MREAILELIKIIAPAVLTLIGVLVVNSKSQAVAQQKNEDIQQSLRQDILRLEAKQDKYNSVKDRMFAVENATNVLFERTDIMTHRLDSIESKLNK